MQLQHAPAGEVIITENAREEKLFVISPATDGDQRGELPRRDHAGRHVGEMALIDNRSRSATVTAKSECNLLVMDRTHFHEVIRKEPVLGTKLLWAFTQELSKRLREDQREPDASAEAVGRGSGGAVCRHGR